jgi:hypothetical protein
LPKNLNKRETSMNRRQLFLSTAKAALASTFGSSLLAGKAKAQPSTAVSSAASEGVTTGNAGSPGATISIDGRVLPPTPPAFGGVIKAMAKDSKSW